MFEFELSEDKRHLLIRVESTKFDITFAPEFRRLVEQAWDPDIETVAIDFTSVDFIDSSGVGALVSVHKRAARKGSVLEIRNPGPGVTSIIELLRLHRVFKLVEV